MHKVVKETRMYRVTMTNLREGDEVFQNAVHGAFNVSLMQELVETSPEKFKMMHLDLVQEHMDYVLGFIGLNQAVISSMTPQRRDEPVLGVWLEDESPLLLIDGHHRIVRRWRDGLRDVWVKICPTEMIPQIKIEILKEPKK